MAENRPAAAPPELPAPKRDTVPATQQRLADRKRQLPRERTT